MAKLSRDLGGTAPSCLRRTRLPMHVVMRSSSLTADPMRASQALVSPGPRLAAPVLSVTGVREPCAFGLHAHQWTSKPLLVMSAQLSCISTPLHTLIAHSDATTGLHSPQRHCVNQSTKHTSTNMPKVMTPRRYTCAQAACEKKVSFATTDELDSHLRRKHCSKM